MIRLSVDSRDKHAYLRFGQQASVFNLPPSRDFDDPNIPQQIQPIGDVECTCFTSAYAAQNVTKVEYDIQDLFGRVPHTAFGADPRQVLGEVLKNGLKVKATGEIVKPFKSYFRADTGSFDAFDNTRLNMDTSESPVMLWTNWYKEWQNMTPGQVMPIGITKVSGHMYAALGWVDGEHIRIEWWGGFTTLMPRQTFNAAIAEWGCGSAIFSNLEIDAIKKRNIVEYLSDCLKNLALILQQQFQKPVETPSIELPPVVNEPKKDLVTLMAKAQEQFEGYIAPSKEYPNGTPAWRNKNPGNIKGQDGKFLVFKTYEDGFDALKNYIVRVAKGLHKAYPKGGSTTIQEYVHIYTGDSEPSPTNYGLAIGKALEVDSYSFKLSQLL